MKNSNKVLVVGASGGSGRKTVEALVKEGHQVTALSRKASQVFESPVKTIDGSALDREVLRKAIKGQDIVIVILGISENHIRTRLLGPKYTPIDIRSHGTRLVVEVMKELGVKRLLVQTTYGSGPSKDKLKLIDRLVFDILLKPQIDDTEVQDQVVRESGLDWTITQPVHLSDEEGQGKFAFSSDNYEVQEWSVSRKLVGECNARLAMDNGSIGKTVSISTVAS
ncbi:MAG: SDR family oxidoreductase [Bdellovibrionales bacterium]|nr:SDR family oxidoreductase [Bdellovibrionales bacterium]NQZ18240.1 SDR family oxidoreductase [Bdellovibrionales bacterium]